MDSRRTQLLRRLQTFLKNEDRSRKDKEHEKELERDSDDMIVWMDIMHDLKESIKRET